MRFRFGRRRKSARRRRSEAKAGARRRDGATGLGLGFVPRCVAALLAKTEVGMSRLVECLVILASFWVADSAGAQSVAQFYTGRQISLTVGSTAGGGYDTQARLVARHLGKHISGNPTIVVQNMPAAGSLAATNHMYNIAPKDGSAIALVQRGMLLIKNWNPSAVRFALGKFNWIGSINSEVALAASWHTAPHRTAQDLFEKELVVGATNGIDPETTPRLLNALIGTKFKVVTGYPGVTEVVLAMERGEVQGIGDWSVSSIKTARPDWIPQKKINVLMQIALQKDPEFAHVPF